jgi:hypothetical protein
MESTRGSQYQRQMDKGARNKNLTNKQQMKLRIQFNNKAALKAAETYLINQNAPFRNSTIDNVYELQFFTERWANRAESELKAFFADDNNTTSTVESVITKTV